MALAPPVRKKLRGDHQPGDPLPVPIASLTGFPSSAASWNYYGGVYKDGVVTVMDLNHVASLWHNGYFGVLKNTSIQRNALSNDRPNKFQKRWELLETEGIKDASYFRKTIELDDDCVEVTESLPCDADNSDCELIEEGSNTNDNSQEEKMKLDHSDGIKDENVRPGKIMKDHKVDNHEHRGDDDHTTMKKVLRTSFEQEDQRGGDSDLNCKTIMTFDSDQISSIFFDDFDVNTSSGHMELLLEEATFLSYALGCLVVKKDNTHGELHKFQRRRAQEQAMTIDEMWREFVRQDPKFVVRYAVYHHYRTKGWVVKSGLKFGADFVLYPVGPPFYHAQFTVMIQSIWSDNNERDDSLSSREMSWTSLAATERLNTHVKKMPLICYVLRPRSLTFRGLSDINCLESLTVKEVLMSRWDPTTTNDPEKETIILD